MLAPASCAASSKGYFFVYLLFAAAAGRVSPKSRWRLASKSVEHFRLALLICRARSVSWSSAAYNLLILIGLWCNRCWCSAVLICFSHCLAGPNDSLPVSNGGLPVPNNSLLGPNNNEIISSYKEVKHEKDFTCGGCSWMLTFCGLFRWLDYVRVKASALLHSIKNFNFSGGWNMLMLF